MARLLLFGPAGERAGRRSDHLDGRTVDDLLGAAVARYGPHFASLLPFCRIWVNGREAEPAAEVEPTDEVAILPPVSGG